MAITRGEMVTIFNRLGINEFSLFTPEKLASRDRCRCIIKIVPSFSDHPRTASVHHREFTGTRLNPLNSGS